MEVPSRAAARGGGSGEALVAWNDVQKRLPWGVLLLLGGGFALAEACLESGLSAKLSDQLSGLSALPPPLVALLLMLLVSATTAVTSNVATASIFLPVVASLAQSMEVNPLLFMMSCTLTTSLAFVLPVSTPPNALAVASGRLRVLDMAPLGACLNLVGVGVVLAGTYALGVPLFELGGFPEWAESTASASTAE